MYARNIAGYFVLLSLVEFRDERSLLAPVRRDPVKDSLK